MSELKPVTTHFTLPAAPVLARRPAAWMIVALLVVGASGQVVARASERDAIARAAAVAAASARAGDSTSLALRARHAGTLKPDELIALDSAVHAAPFRVSHDSLHQRSATAALDSAARMLRRAIRSEPALTQAQALLATVVEPLSNAQGQRLSSLRDDAARIARQQRTVRPKRGGGK